MRGGGTQIPDTEAGILRIKSTNAMQVKIPALQEDSLYSVYGIVETQALFSRVLGHGGIRSTPERYNQQQGRHRPNS